MENIKSQLIPGRWTAKQIAAGRTTAIISGSAHCDRRRPRRNANLSSELIPLLRGTARIVGRRTSEFASKPNLFSRGRGFIWGLLLMIAERAVGSTRYVRFR